MTDEQKFEFDRKGWFMIPGVLTAHECDAIRNQLLAAYTAPGDENEKEARRWITYQGPAGELLDHPVVVDVLREIIGQDYSDQAYGFRCDSSFHMVRTLGSKPPTPPHGGAMDFWPLPVYRCDLGRVFSWSVRAVWEINPVTENQGGTLFLTGSHKSNLHVPESYKQADHHAFDTYSCPAGSVIFFCEALCHSSATWTDANNDRLCVLNHYLNVMSKLHEDAPSVKLVEQMPEKRRSLFRGVWAGVHRKNLKYSKENRAV